MNREKQVKAEFKKKAGEQPEKYYATSVLREEGFRRNKCSNCNTYYWAAAEGNVCGEPACSGGFRFFEGTPAKHKLSYVEVWQKFSQHFKKRGYEPIRRYPVTARWRDDTDFVQASIYDFQPYVVSGEVEPPANPLVVPQFCLRFNDIDNVGITGSHYTGFVMIGQHAFTPPEKYKQDDYFRDIHSWLKEGLGLPNHEIKYHEDVWAGGGNFGPSMEYFSRGLELGNQVYMQYAITGNSYKQLDLNVLDMGMGQERNAWFTTGEATSYEATFPPIIKKLFEKTGIKMDKTMQQKFIPYSSYLNLDEIEDADKVWNLVAEKTGYGIEELKKQVIPLSALYSVAEHSRSLLVSLSDGAMPSNVKGGYNLRVILRRALSFIEKYKWDIDLAEICEWHADYLRKQFPELKENLEDVHKILDIEKEKFKETRARSKRIVAKLIEKKIDTEKLVELYDSQGINPDLIKDEAEKEGKTVEIPDNFYALVAERHEEQEQKTATKKKTDIKIGSLPETKILYYQDYKKNEFEARIEKIIDNKYVVLDQTYFYATSGGQENDTGTIGGIPVVDVIRQGKIIIHAVEDSGNLKEGQEVECKINPERRKQLSQHHTATHILNGAARKLLGNHVWQAGAAKFVDKARIDLTHYEQLTNEQIEKLEKMCNEVIKKNITVEKKFVPREEAESKFGFSIYQGGIVPGKLLRMVNIKCWDVEACGGTHLDKTGEAEQLKILKTSKIQDGVIRIEFAAGNAASKAGEQKSGVIDELAKILKCQPNQVPGRAEELFNLWKTVVKKKKTVESTELRSTKEFDGDILAKTADIFKTQPEHVVKTAKRFLSEIDKQ